VAVADIDHFKRLNDEYGHEVGDRALRVFAEVLRDNLRPDDIVARVGGEEFVVILPGCEPHGAAHALERVRSALSVCLQRARLPLFTVSFGVAELSAGTPFKVAFETADEALYEAKRLGRDQVVISRPAPVPLALAQ
jgi:diguanylate cyclase